MRYWPCILILSATAMSAFPDESPTRGVIEEVVVYGRAEQQIGSAHAASQGMVGYADVRLPPLLRVGELVEAVPGMVATQHSGTGKANQYFLRGFNLDHGTDFAAFAGGVPLNMRTHGHGQGYLDLNFLIPEMVKTAEYRKGPYSAEVGDFSSAGSVQFSFYDRLPETVLGITLGEDDYRRGLLAGSADVGAGAITGALDLTRYNGPWELQENLEQNKFHLGYIAPVGSGQVRLTLQGYDGEWDATDQIPRRAVESGLIDELGFIDPDLGGQTERYAFTAGFEQGDWRLSAYAVHSDFALFSNFSYFLEDPRLGDEFEQRDERTVYGANVQGTLVRDWGHRAWTIRWGGEIRYDDIDEVGLYRTSSRVRTGIIRRDSVEEWSLGAFGEAEVELTERLRGIAGLRADHFDWDVAAFQAGNGGSGNDSLLSPNIGLAYRMTNSLEVYASWGRGFHSNDVRGATIAVDPVSGDSVQPVDGLVESEGAELGVRYEHGRRFNATLVGFLLDLDSELIYVGDAGTTEPNNATERRGVELTAFWQAAPWLAMNAAYTVTDAEFKGNEGGREIPGSVESTFALGFNATWASGLSASARLRYLGEAPLLEDASVRTEDSVLLNAGVAYRRGRAELRLDVFNLLDSNDTDIAYFYASRLPGEPDGGVEDVHFHPLEPRSLRGTLTMHW